MSSGASHNFRRYDDASTGLPKQDRLVTPLQVAERLAIVTLVADPHKEVLRLARRGRLIGRRVGKHMLIVESSVDKYIATGSGA